MEHSLNAQALGWLEDEVGAIARELGALVACAARSPTWACSLTALGAR